MTKVKVCGMRNSDNISKVLYACPDILGFIFYQGSRRYVGENPDKGLAALIPENILKAGVFVNERKTKIIELAKLFGLDMLQLHGRESVALCEELMNTGYSIIKAFGINDDFDFKRLIPYARACDYYLFDTGSEQHGGTGRKFNWSLLGKYELDKPFFLSGGIGPEDIEKVRNLNHPAFYGVDINSGFEVKPGIKDPEKVKTFICQVKNIET